MPGYLGLDFKISAGLESRAKEAIKNKVAEIIEDDPMEEIITMIMIIASNKYAKDREAAKEDLLEVIEEDEQVDQILSWLENDLPSICQSLAAGGEPQQEEAPVQEVKKEAEVPQIQQQPVKEVAQVKKEEAQEEDIAEIYKEHKQQNQQIKKEKMLKKRKPQKKNNQRGNKPNGGIKKKPSILDRIKPKNNKSSASKNGGLKRKIIKKNMVPFSHTGDADKALEEDKVIPETLKQAMGEAKIKRRCRFFPKCNNQNCEFVHPSLPCEKFPKCIFGDQCLYLHPEIECKFGFKCQRPGCSYKHPAGFKPYFPYYNYKKQFQGDDNHDGQANLEQIADMHQQ